MQTPDPRAAGDFRGSRHRPTAALLAWHASVAPERALEPQLPIVDPHHHLFGAPPEAYFYRRDDLAADLGSGHRVMGTVYLEAYGSGWYTSGPEEMKPVGEVEMILRACGDPIPLAHGACQAAAGVVSSVDLTLGDGVVKVIEAQLAAAQGRLRGVRHYLTYDPGIVGRYVHNMPARLAADADFRKGYAWLERFDLAFDAFLFHTQLQDLVELADAFPRTRILLNHVGTPIGVADYAQQRESVLAEWRQGMCALARRPNVVVKVGGMGMPVFGFGFEHADHPASSAALVEAWQPLIDLCIDAFGAERCMLESNFPVDKQSTSYVALWNAFKMVTRGLPDDQRQHLFYRTACRTYRLPELEKACDAAWGAPVDVCS